MDVFVDDERDSGDNIREVVIVFSTGHNAKEIRFLRMIDDATVMKLSFFGVVIESFAKLVREGGVFWKKFTKTLLVVNLSEERKSFFRHFLVEVRRVIEDTEEGRVLLDGNVVVGVVDDFLRIDTKIGKDLENFVFRNVFEN